LTAEKPNEDTGAELTNDQPNGEECAMSEMSSGSAANSTSRPDAAAGDMPAESDLPAMQGLESGVSGGTMDNPGAADADLADDAGSVSETSTEGNGTGPSDPMPDVAGTGG
jgi:hypothetical protein